MLGDLNKLKVVELKAELANRGMDTKGVKAVLVDRLKAALEQEGGGPTMGSPISPNEDHRSSHDSNDDGEEAPSTPSRRGRRTGSTKETTSAEEGYEATSSFEEERVLPPAKEDSTASIQLEQAASDAPKQPASDAPEQAASDAPKQVVSVAPEQAVSDAPEQAVSDAPEQAVSVAPEQAASDASEKAASDAPVQAASDAPVQAASDAPVQAASDTPEQAVSGAPEEAVKGAPEQAVIDAPEHAVSDAPEHAVSDAPEQSSVAPVQSSSNALEQTASYEPQHTFGIHLKEDPSPKKCQIFEGATDGLIHQDAAIEAEDTVKSAVDDESSESKSSYEQQDSNSEQLKEPKPSSEVMEDEPMPSDEESKPSSTELIGDSESSNSNLPGEQSLLTETDEDSLLKSDVELAPPESSHESTNIKVEPPDSQEIKTEPGYSPDGMDVKEEQADNSRRSRKSRFTDNDDPVQSGSDVKEEPMDSDATADGASEHVKSEPSNDRKRRRSSSRSSRRSRSPQLKKQQDDEPEIDDTAVLLSWYDSDLNLVIEKENFLTATPLHQLGFAYIWAGARASFGYLKGKICYEVKCEEECDVSHLQDEPNPHVLRVGWSVQGTTMQLGEEKGSYGYGGTGKSSVNCQFKDYGRTFGAGDIITAYLDMDSEPKILSYSVNGESQGVAYEVSSDALAGKALFPHILSKNMKFSINFSSEPAHPLTEGFTLCGNVPLEDRVAGPRRPEKKEDCEMIMMCGLPGAGKTFWANKHFEENPDKLMNILGTNNLIDKMKVMGLPRKRNYSGRWDVLIDKCTKCLTKLFEIAGRRRRNYILDQTNVYPSAVRRKMKAFNGFKRRAVIIVPTDDEFQRRVAKREAEEGKDVPDSAVLEMKANFKLPEVGDLFSEVVHVELPEEESLALVEKYREEAKEKGFVAPAQQSKRFKSERSGGSGDRRHDDRHSSRESRDHRERGRDYRDNRGDSRGDSRDHRDRERNTYRPRGGPMDRNRSGWQPRGMQQGGGWRDRNDGFRGNRNDSRGQWRSGGGGGGGRGGMGGAGGGGGGSGGSGYDRYRGGGSYNQSRGGYGGRGASKGWGYNQGSGGSSWGNWNQQSQEYSQLWPSQSQSQTQSQSTGYGGTSWKGYGQQQQQLQHQQHQSQPHHQQSHQQSQQSQHGYGQQQAGYTTQGYSGYGNGNNSYNWNQQYYGNYGNWGQQAQGAASATGASAGTGASSTPAIASSTSTYDPYQQWNQFTTYGYSTSSGSTAAGATGASHGGK